MTLMFLLFESNLMGEPEILALAHLYGEQVKFDKKALLRNRDNLSVFSIYWTSKVVKAQL